MVETGHRQSADVVVVEGAEERKEQPQGCCTQTQGNDLAKQGMEVGVSSNQCNF